MMFLKELQDLSNILEISFLILTIYEDGIKEEKDKVPKIRFQNIIHEALEGGGHITESKRHNQKLIEAFMSAKIHLRNLFLFHPDLMVSHEKIQFGEILGFVKLIQ